MSATETCRQIESGDFPWKSRLSGGDTLIHRGFAGRFRFIFPELMRTEKIRELNPQPLRNLTIRTVSEFLLESF